MLSDVELDRIFDIFQKGSFFQREILALVAEVRRLRIVRIADAELERIRAAHADRKDRNWSGVIYERVNEDIDALLARIAFQSTVIADLKTDLANENQFAAGFRAAREMMTNIVRQGREDAIEVHDYPAAIALRDTVEMIASLTPEDYAAQMRREDT